MGYTHYWQMTRSFTEAEWSILQDYAGKVVTAARAEGIKLGNGCGEAGTDPEITSTEICLNGVGDDGYETFMLTRRGSPFEFCKTARCGYDPVVVTLIHAAATIAPDCLTESSDGDESDGALMFHFTDQVPPPKRPRKVAKKG